MNTIQNPIIKGFNPDPSIVKVGDDYYIATSTFEWFPGVQIHHSKDLANWKLVAHPLNRTSQLNMAGNPNSGGIYAPCLTYNQGLFYLIYTDVKNIEGLFWDSHNYMVTATDICGEWSEPVSLNSSGIDPSLFHDDDGRKWIVNMQMDHRAGYRARFPKWSGIILQEFDVQQKKLIGQPIKIFEGSELGITEGPHLYKRNGYYYLLTAEGGTFQEHSVTVARSSNLFGPYEIDPMNPILTAKNDVTVPLQRCGHADIVETQNGEWYMVHLCGRQMPARGRCVMGRETAIQKVKWTEDGWLRLECGGNKPQLQVPAPALTPSPWESEPVKDDFDKDVLNINFQTLRVPLGEDALSLTERPGYLRLKGHESLSSKHYQSLVARRQQAFRYTASTCVEFDPESHQHMAGLVCLYDTTNYYYLHITYDQTLGKCVSIMVNDLNDFSFPVGNGISIGKAEKCYLKVEVNYDKMQFFYGLNENEWIKIGPEFDASKLSDEYFKGQNIERFTGAFVGLCCQDFTYTHKPADFDYFEYIEK